MKFNLVIFLFFIILLGWIGLFQLFGSLERSDFLRTHICQEQLSLLNTTRDLLESNGPSKNEKIRDCYYRLEKNMDVLIHGGAYKYLNIEARLSAEKSQSIIFDLTNFKNSLKRAGDLRDQIVNGSLNSNSARDDLFTNLDKNFLRISEHFNLESQRKLSRKVDLFMLWGAVTIVTLALGIVVYKRKYLRPINELNRYSSALIKGSFAADRHPIVNSQFEKLYHNLFKVGERFKGVSEFIKNIGNGNFDQEYEVEGETDLLGTSLIDLRNQLKKMSLKDRERIWANEGLSKFNNIIQAQRADINELAEVLICELVKYVSANQGAIFQMTEDGSESEQMLEMISAYAWGRKKFVEKKLDLKNNLVGQAVLAREYVLIKDVPEEFVQITSGLGKATPRSIIILPLIFNDVCYGAMELASFTEFDDKQISFLNRLSENIASAILNITGNARTKKLLEDSQSLTEQLKLQEDALRENEKELEAAAKEMQDQLKNVEAEKLKNIAILEGCEDGVIMFKENGIVEFINSTASELFGVNKNQVLGDHIDGLIPIEIVKSEKENKVYFTGSGQFLPIALRTEISLYDDNGHELSLLVTASEGKVESDVTFAFFIQNISVELF